MKTTKKEFKKVKVKVKSMEMILLKNLIDEQRETEFLLNYANKKMFEICGKIQEFVNLEYPSYKEMHWIVRMQDGEIWFRDRLGKEKIMGMFDAGKQ